MTNNKDRLLQILSPRLAPQLHQSGVASICPNNPDDLHLVVDLANQCQVSLVLEAPQQDDNDVFVDISSLNRMVRYRQEEFLITVESGISIAMMEQHLSSYGHTLGLRYPKDRTLLSLLGEDTVSLSQIRHGRLNQRITGIKALTGDAQWIHYGGEVMKNVTGYDLIKLFTGSQHQYGIITQITLKTVPCTETSRSFLFHLETLDQALDFCQKLAQLLPSPEILTMFRLKGSFGWQVLLTLCGPKDVVVTESEGIHAIISHLHSELQELYLAPMALEKWIRKLDWTHPEESQTMVVEIALPTKSLLDSPYHLFQLGCGQSADWLIPWGSNHLKLRWHSVHQPSSEALLELKQQVEALSGQARIVKAPISTPLEFIKGFNQANDPTLQTWQTRLKTQFDPQHILSSPFSQARQEEALR